MDKKVYDFQFKMAAVQLMLEDPLFIREVGKRKNELRLD